MNAPPTPSRSAARRACLLSAALALLPVAALAHPGAAGAAHGFLDGFVHPFSGADHLGAALAAGLWGARGRRAGLAPIVFMIGLALGAGASALGLALPAIEPMIAFSLFGLGLLLASQVAPPPTWGVVLAGGFALWHGAAHGIELGTASALAGLLCASALVCVVGAAIGFALRGRSPDWTRSAGFALAAFGASRLAAL